jgi:hypothetical protein
MSNTRSIQPITTWTPEGEKTINLLALSNFSDYHFDDGAGKVEYKLIGADPELGATEYFINKLEVPASIIQQWGADDEIIWDYVVTTLGLVIV